MHYDPCLFRHWIAALEKGAAAGLRNRLLAFSVRPSPRSVARKIAGALNKSGLTPVRHQSKGCGCRSDLFHPPGLVLTGANPAHGLPENTSGALMAMV